ncbi:MAG: hypothetical protein J7619_00990 [Dyadobacter sp.]|uniref:hypothetical protein n=1 Tax=Dyadobacter sp. TaxID=1914288 RepID=UPI001B2A6467|nr:hypothetical protein [Dyadobacter sp.]MBO9611233.1 hypothetical protein [Dyadobacter sp.]
MEQTFPFRSVPKTLPVSAKAFKRRTPSYSIKHFFNEGNLTKCLSSDRRMLITSIIIFAVVLLFTYPRYLELISDNNLGTNYAYFFDKVSDPLAAVQVNQETHGGKIDFRFTVPLLAKILGVSAHSNGHSVIVIYLIQSALLVPFLFMLMKILLTRLSPMTTLLLVMGSSTIYLAKSFFWDYDFWFDGFAYFFLAFGMYLKNRVGVFLTLTLACWTDERAVVALASIYLFHLLSESDFDLQSFRQFRGKKDWLQRTSSIVLLTGASYLIIRALLASLFGLHTPTGTGSGVELGLIPYQLKHRLSGVFLTFEGLWVLFLFAVGLLARKGNLLLALSLLAIMAGHILIAYSVFDISRSLTYAFPLIIISAFIISKHEIRNVKYLYAAAAAICVLLPTQYVIFYPRQIPWTILSFEELKPVIKLLLL